MAGFDGLVLGLALGALFIATPAVMIVAAMVVASDRRRDESRPAPAAPTYEYTDNRRIVIIGAPAAPVAFQGYPGGPGPATPVGMLTPGDNDDMAVYVPQLRRRLPAGREYHETIQ